ncbi:type II toxin-antitoxin system antitoxin [Sphingobacterium hungaricum]|uniref:Arc family DNA binding domain-containing protein n=1 Tax=Sphingobacterium hungaricum TaxID=2082723 RepID=A0A928V2Z1_9SPHI|nr:Arc family DNA binding domain-containing protein [Sphingobacterium hungaricum]MBE8715174.1 Arc family DNA binding domain-containing protein [Sphingobacterium hungaricum]
MSDKETQKTSGKKNFVLRIDEQTFKLLEAWANDEFRSVNGQIEYLLNESLAKSGRKKKEKPKK